MYESLFGLRERPFASAPLASAWFPAESHEHARRQAQRCVERAAGAGVVIGAAGMGKSLLLQLLAEQFREQFHVALLAGAAVCTRRALLQNILYALNLPYRGLQEGELRLALMDHLQPSRQCPHGMLLLIDEAHTLPLRLLEELRLLTNLVREGSPRVRLVLAGSPALEERLASPKLESFNQRIAVRCYLEALTSAETADYVRHEIARCGGDVATIFAPDALRAIHIAAAGIPRLVNQLCDHALTLAAAAGCHPVDAAAIQQAWADLQQLPAPWLDDTPRDSASIEFGVLEDHGSASNQTMATDDTADDRVIPLDDDLDDVTTSSPVVFAGIEPAHVEIGAPTAAELFGDDFEEEEIVIDRYAALDAAAMESHPQVITAEGQVFAREVAIVLAQPVRPALKVVQPPISPLVEQAVGNSGRSDLQDDREYEPSLDPVYPEQVAAAAPKPVKIAAIDAAEPPQGMHGKAPSGRFRHLFASLRGKKK